MQIYHNFFDSSSKAIQVLNLFVQYTYINDSSQTVQYTNAQTLISAYGARIYPHARPPVSPTHSDRAHCPSLRCSARCPVCQYPNRGDASIWRRMLHKQTVTEDVPVDMDHFIVSPGLKLTLQGAVPTDSGIYICQNYFTVHAVYNIDVVPFLHPKTVRPAATAPPKVTNNGFVYSGQYLLALLA